MNRFSFEMKIGLLLVVLALALNGLLYAIYKDMDHILLWGLTNLAFLPISVLFVSLILDSFMEKRARAQKLEKLNMLIGTFFSIAGTRLLHFFAQWDLKPGEICELMVEQSTWKEQKSFQKMKARLSKRHFQIKDDTMDLEALRNFMAPNTDFMLRLLENTHVLEHESFTDVLRTALHLGEELKARGDLSLIPDSDRSHLARDIERAYGHLALAWMDYMDHLQGEFPYLFSYALRINPFDENASPVVGS